MSSLSPFPPSRLKVGSPSTSSVFSSRAGHKGGGKRERVAQTDCYFATQYCDKYYYANAAKEYTEIKLARPVQFLCGLERKEMKG